MSVGWCFISSRFSSHFSSWDDDPKNGVQDDGVLVAVNPRNATVLQEQGLGPGKLRPFK